MGAVQMNIENIKDFCSLIEIGINATVKNGHANSNQPSRG
jgi:hypothetical protein